MPFAELLHYITSAASLLVIVTCLVLIIRLVLDSKEWKIPVQDAKYLQLMRQDQGHTMAISHLELKADAAMAEIEIVKQNVSIVIDRLNDIEKSLMKSGVIK